jgi:hypothetical protein
MGALITACHHNNANRLGIKVSMEELSESIAERKEMRKAALDRASYK